MIEPAVPRMALVRRVLAPNPGPFTLEGTNTWIVGRGPSLVIDPGPDDAGHILTIVDEAEPVEAVLLTHQHPDHAPGAWRLAASTGAQVYAFDPDEGERRLADGDVVEAGSVGVRAVHTPGHSQDHVAFFIEPERLLFTGDAVLGRGTSVVDPPEGDMAAYIRSLERMRELEPRTIYPGHGPAVFTPLGKLDEYIRHRRLREEQVLAAVAAGRHRAEEMASGIYGDEVPAEMLPAAARTVLAHLLKLEREGRVVRTGRAKDERFLVVEPRTCVRCERQAAPGSRYCRRCGLAVLQEGPTREASKE